VFAPQEEAKTTWTVSDTGKNIANHYFSNIILPEMFTLAENAFLLQKAFAVILDTDVSGHLT
jgi:hypothetical protein